jgi:hypothetical protein
VAIFRVKQQAKQQTSKKWHTFAGCLPDLLFDPEDEGGIFI